MYMYKHVTVQKLNAESYALPTEWRFDILKWCCKPTFIRFWEIFRKIRESIIVANISRHGTVFDIYIVVVIIKNRCG